MKRRGEEERERGGGENGIKTGIIGLENCNSFPCEVAVIVTRTKRVEKRTEANLRFNKPELRESSTCSSRLVFSSLLFSVPFFTYTNSRFSFPACLEARDK